VKKRLRDVKMAKMNIPEDLRAEFENTWEQSLSQFEAAAERGLPVREIDVHFLRKLDAMLKQDYKRLYEMELKERQDEREAAKPKWFGGQPAANAFGTIAAPPFFGATATGGAGLCATATAVASPADSFSSMPPLEAQPPPLLMPQRKEPSVEDCPLHWLHWTQIQTTEGGGAMLGHTANSRGYSMYSPPCNGCSIGQRERAAGLWHSGFGEERNVFYSAASPIDASLMARKAEFMEPEPKSPIRPQRSAEEVWAAVCDVKSARAAAALERLERINLGEE
jgi:hypothetical protein